jgi:hypothetical protein
MAILFGTAAAAPWGKCPACCCRTGFSLSCRNAPNPAWGCPYSMAGRRNREIRDQDVQGLKCLRKIRPLLSRLRKVGTERDRAGNRRLFRRLFMDQYCARILIYTGEKPNRAMCQMVWYSLIGTWGSLLRRRWPTSQAHSGGGGEGLPLPLSRRMWAASRETWHRAIFPWPTAVGRNSPGPPALTPTSRVERVEA